MKRRAVACRASSQPTQTALLVAQDDKAAATSGRLPDGYWRHYSMDETPLSVRALFVARYGHQPRQVLPVLGETWAAGPLDYPQER